MPTSADTATVPTTPRDLTQAFFTSLLERRDFEQLTRERGRFRAFLLASLKHFLANDFARRRTLKRGGGVAPVSLSFDHAEERYAREPADVTTPEMLYERRWALTVIERVSPRFATNGGGSSGSRNSMRSAVVCSARRRPVDTRRWRRHWPCRRGR